MQQTYMKNLKHDSPSDNITQWQLKLIKIMK